MTTPLALPAPTIRTRGYETEEGLHRRWRIWGVLLLVVLNIGDLLTTYAFLNLGVEEGNPIAKALMGGRMEGVVKSALLIALAYRIWKRPPRLGTTCLLWCVVGIYTCVVGINTAIVLTLR